jgi:hypothetical protein
MPTINTNTRPFTDTLQRGNYLTVICEAGGVALVNITGSSGATRQATVGSGESKLFGPFHHDAQVKVSMASGQASVAESVADELAIPLTVVSTSPPDDNDGRPDGTIYIQLGA